MAVRAAASCSSAASAALFLVGAVVLWRGAKNADAEEAEAEEEFAGKAAGEARGIKVVATSFGVLFLAEWGDLSQLLNAGLAARYQDPLSVFVGSWVALVLVAGLAAVIGRTLLRYVRLATIRRVGALVCLLLASLATYELVQSVL